MADDGALTVSVKEAARLLGVCRAVVDAAIHAGEIPCVKLGRSHRIPKAAIYRLVETGNATTKSEGIR